MNSITDVLLFKPSETLSYLLEPLTFLESKSHTALFLSNLHNHIRAYCARTFIHKLSSKQ